MITITIIIGLKINEKIILNIIDKKIIAFIQDVFNT